MSRAEQWINDVFDIRLILKSGQDEIQILTSGCVRTVFVMFD